MVDTLIDSVLGSELFSSLAFYFYTLSYISSDCLSWRTRCALGDLDISHLTEATSDKPKA
jgi:hypothetical protein